MKTFALICEYCQSSFTSHRKRRCCNRSCSRKLTIRLSGAEAWSKKEIDLLEAWEGIHPLPEIIQKLQRYQRRNGLTVRSAIAIQVKFKRLKLSCKCTLDNFNRSEIARILGIDRERVRGWSRNHGLPIKLVARNQSAVELATLKAFAASHPHLFGGIDGDSLFWLFQDQSLVDLLTSQPVYRDGKPHPVRQVETSRIFPSIREAARHCFVDRACIQSAIKRNGTSAGYHWEFAEETIAS